MIIKAELSDAEDIYNLLGPAVDEGKILYKSLDEVYQSIRSFCVYRSPNGGALEGTSALYIYGPDLAEVRSLVVDPAARGQGLGRKLVEFCLKEAIGLKIPQVFALTYEPEFFSKVGFSLTTKDRFPEKVFKDCARCPMIDACDEHAVIVNLP